MSSYCLKNMNESVVVKGDTAAPFIAVESCTSRNSSPAFPNSGIIENFLRVAESMDDCRVGKEEIPVLLRYISLSKEFDARLLPNDGNCRRTGMLLPVSRGSWHDRTESCRLCALSSSIETPDELSIELSNVDASSSNSLHTFLINREPICWNGTDDDGCSDSSMSLPQNAEQAKTLTVFSRIQFNVMARRCVRFRRKRAAAKR